MAPFRAHLHGEGLSDKTIRVYAIGVRKALEWCDAEGLDLDSLDASQLRSLSDAMPRGHSAMRQLRAGLAHYYAMIGRHDAPLRAIRVPKKPNYKNRALSKDDARLLAKAARYRVPEGVAVGFGLYMALRVHEIATAQWSRFSDDMDWYRVLGKFDETYELPVHPVLQEDLRYMRRETDYVFPGSKGRPHVTDQTVWNWVRDVSDFAGVGKVSTHVLRHTAITTANDNTGDLRAVSAFARHKRLETTRLYTRTTSEQLTRVVMSIDYESD